MNPDMRREDIYRVRATEVDPHRQLRVPALCGWMQESGWQHAAQLGLGHGYLLQKGLAWVLSRQLVRIYRLPLWGEAVKVLTWPSGHDRLFAYRDFHFLDSEDSLIGEATSTWFVMDLTSRKPQRTAAYFPAELPPTREPWLPARLARLDAPAASLLTASRQVGYSDLDMNRHLNHVRFIEWVAGSLDADFLEKYSLQELEINFLAEARLMDEVECFIDRLPGTATAEPVINHRLAAKDPATDLCRAVTRWRPVE